MERLTTPFIPTVELVHYLDRDDSIDQSPLCPVCGAARSADGAAVDGVAPPI